MDLRTVVVSLASSAEQIKEIISAVTSSMLEVELRLKVDDRNWNVLINALSKDAQITAPTLFSYDMYKRHGVKNATLRISDRSSAVIKENLFSDIIMFLDYPIKVSMSIERTMTPFPTDGLLHEGKRTISRREACMNGFVVHLSEVTTLPSETQSKEMEIEILSPEADYNHIQLIISQALISRTEYKKIRKQIFYKESGTTVLDVRHSKWPKPVSITIRDILYNFSSSYAITEKTDGERVFLLHTEWGLFQTSPMENTIQMISYERTRKLVIFDAELCSNGANTVIHVFDVFSSLVLNERMQLVRKFCTDVQRSLRQGLRIVAKEHFFFDGYEEMIQRIKQFPASIEGFVFTPKKHAAHVYKWKKRDTVDFLMKEGKLIIGKGKDSGYKLLSSHSHSPTPAKEGSIVECFISVKDKKATLMRVRKDRALPNSFDTFLRIIESIGQKDKLLKCFKGEGMTLLRALHNDLKKKILSTFKGHLLDVGSGRGGDIRKWKHFDKVTCIDPDAEAIAAFNERLAECGFSQKITMRQCSLSQFAESAASSLDNMSCFFCLNMFSDKEVDALVALSSECNNIAIIAMTDEIKKLPLKRVSIQGISNESYIIDIPGTFVRNVSERFIDIDRLCKRILERGNFKLTSFSLTSSNISSFLGINCPLFLSVEEEAFSSCFRLLLFEHIGTAVNEN